MEMAISDDLCCGVRSYRCLERFSSWKAHVRSRPTETENPVYSIVMDMRVISSFQSGRFHCHTFRVKPFDEGSCKYLRYRNGDISRIVDDRDICLQQSERDILQQLFQAYICVIVQNIYYSVVPSLGPPADRKRDGLHGSFRESSVQVNVCTNAKCQSQRDSSKIVDIFFGVGASHCHSAEDTCAEALSAACLDMIKYFGLGGLIILEIAEVLHHVYDNCERHCQDVGG